MKLFSEGCVAQQETLNILMSLLTLEAYSRRGFGYFPLHLHKNSYAAQHAGAAIVRNDLRHSHHCAGCGQVMICHSRECRSYEIQCPCCLKNLTEFGNGVAVWEVKDCPDCLESLKAVRAERVTKKITQRGI